MRFTYHCDLWKYEKNQNVDAQKIVQQWYPSSDEQIPNIFDYIFQLANADHGVLVCSPWYCR